MELPTWPPFLKKPVPANPTAGFPLISRSLHSCCYWNRNSCWLTAHSADYALLVGLLRSSWWLILGLFLHLTHLLALMLPPIVAVTLVVQSQAGYIGCHSVLFAPMPPPTPRVLSSLSSFLWFHERLLGMFRRASRCSWCDNCLSRFVSLPSIPAYEICGEGAFSVMGHWEDLRETQGPLLPRGTDPTAQKSIHIEARQSGTGAMQEVSGALRPKCLPHTWKVEPHLSLVCHCSLRVVTWQLHRWEIPQITSEM